MSYRRYDKDNQLVSPQPISVAQTYLGGNVGWTTIVSPDWNGNYVKRDVNNNPVTPGTYQRRDVNNNPVGVGTYQRHDENCDPIYA
jgi:hypothetical protein